MSTPINPTHGEPQTEPGTPEPVQPQPMRPAEEEEQQPDEDRGELVDVIGRAATERYALALDELKNL